MMRDPPAEDEVKRNSPLTSSTITGDIEDRGLGSISSEEEIVSEPDQERG